jgi:hypothetical protein
MKNLFFKITACFGLFVCSCLSAAPLFCIYYIGCITKIQVNTVGFRRIVQIYPAAGKQSFSKKNLFFDEKILA